MVVSRWSNSRTWAISNCHLPSQAANQVHILRGPCVRLPQPEGKGLAHLSEPNALQRSVGDRRRPFFAGVHVQLPHCLQNPEAKAEIRLRFYDARHTFVTRLAENFSVSEEHNSATRRARQPQDAQSLRPYPCSSPPRRHFDPRIAPRGPDFVKAEKCWGTKLGHRFLSVFRARMHKVIPCM